MMEFLFAELVVRQRILALDDPELRRLHERPQCTALHADRTIAVNHLRQVGLRLVAHAAAMTAALISLGIGHAGLHSVGHAGYPSLLLTAASRERTLFHWRTFSANLKLHLGERVR